MRQSSGSQQQVATATARAGGTLWVSGLQEAGPTLEPEAAVWEMKEVREKAMDGSEKKKGFSWSPKNHVSVKIVSPWRTGTASGSPVYTGH